MKKYKEYIEEYIEEVYTIDDIKYESELKDVIEELQGFVADDDNQYSTVKENIIASVENADDDFNFDALTDDQQSKFIKIAKSVVTSHIKYLNEECELEDDVYGDYYGDDEY